MDAIMDHLVDKADAILKVAFPNAKMEWDPVEPEENLSGWIIWQGFEDVEPIDRQLAVAKALKSGLKSVEKQQISAIFAVTPDELLVMKSRNEEF